MTRFKHLCGTPLLKRFFDPVCFWRRPRSAHHTALWSSLDPIREELFSLERLEIHAKSLALAQTVTDRQSNGHLLVSRLADNESVLLAAYRAVATAEHNARSITPAAAELIDNYHLIEKQIRQIRSDLPAGYYRELPKLDTGPFAGYPRVFGIAWGFVAHTDSSLDLDMLLAYVRAYQEVQPLTIGELWAVSITLRIVLIENLRRLAQKIRLSRADRDRADALADRLLGVRLPPAEPVSVVLVDYETGLLSNSFAVQLVHRLRDQDPRITPAMNWLDGRLAAQGMSADSVVQEEHRLQGAANVSMRNIVRSLRKIADVDWQDVFEAVSLVDVVLAQGCAFKAMDFPTRNLYRSAVEKLARGSTHTEQEIAHLAVAAAQSARSLYPDVADLRRHDPGYYLVAGGRHEFRASLDFHLPWHQWASWLNSIFGIGGYVGIIALVTAFLLCLPLFDLSQMGLGWAALIPLLILGAIPATDAAVAVVNRLMPMCFKATPLPALELRDGIPAELGTLVAVPTLLTTAASIQDHIEGLEIHYLACTDDGLRFALLSDWLDGASEHMAGDEALLDLARAGIADLNRRYGPTPHGTRFLLLHRRRVWNAGEGRWIGWERKRGKLHELNRLLRGARDTHFIGLEAESSFDPAENPASCIRFIVTLDADTRLPRDTVRRLVGKMAHPINQPHFDEAKGRVVEGYAVLQPRVTPSLPIGHEGSLFQRVFSSASGIDPYAAAASDVYQDLFGEGSYAGKGIYDIDAFEKALAGRVPESTLLSHDLLEGIFARAGLASDVEVVEEFPGRYDVNALRHHRWARGDWQLLPWILGLASVSPEDHRIGRAIPAVGLWKMVDNLRRTLSAPVAMIALLAGWFLPFPMALVWTVFIAATIILPTLIPVISAISPARSTVTMESHFLALRRDFCLALSLSLLMMTFLAHQAWLMGDAITRTLWRLFVSRKHLLEWVPAAQAGSAKQLTVLGFYRRMFGAPVLAGLALIGASLTSDGTALLVVPFAVIWLLSPLVGYWVSLSPQRRGQLQVSDKDTLKLRVTARHTWRYFERFVTAADHNLPPDNFQEDPAAVAHRTSPTNIGLYLLSVGAARDFGWIGTAEAVERLEATLATVTTLEKHRGHLYNWYDTRDLRLLEPRYVSSVDSGNLAGHLIALANTCREWQFEIVQSRATRLAGLSDALSIVQQAAARLRAGRKTETAASQHFTHMAAALAYMLQRAAIAPNVATSQSFLADFIPKCAALAALSHELVIGAVGDDSKDLKFWSEACCQTLASQQRDSALGPEAVAELRQRLGKLEDTARTLAMAMEFGFLLDPDRRLLSIGCRMPEAVLDIYCYDLLASEARLASFFAIAKGDLPASHWFRLGRTVTPVAQGAALISWSGSMFEYLMPSLVMRAPEGSLLEQTSRLVVQRQIEYGASRAVPWGISESAYNVRDLEMTYQYSNFGVPGLGLKRGLGDNLVIAPYATGLGAMVDPHAASLNFERLDTIGALGRYGFYEALDYTPERIPEGVDVVVVRAYMAHHQGMTIVALADALMDGAMRARFHAEPMIQATELLLQERTPRDVTTALPWAAGATSNKVLDFIPSGVRRFQSPHQATPATQLLSNGRYCVLMTAAGSGYSRWNDLAITRWREDATCDDYGTAIFLRDVETGAVWSGGFQPSGVEADEYLVEFKEDYVELARADGALTTRLEVLVSAEDDAEVRRISLTNAGTQSREIDVTSYAELVLAPQSADMAHPAFSKLFVETEYLPDVGALLATRRKRSPEEPDIWAGQVCVVEGKAIGEVQVETDRAVFIGRGETTRTARAMRSEAPLTNSVGTVLDPIFSMRRRVSVAPGMTVKIAFWTIVATTREALLDLIDKHRDNAAFTRASTLAWTQGQVQLHHLGINADEAALFQQLAGHIIYANATLRPPSEVLLRGAGAQSGLWSQGISGDLPIVFLRISDAEDIEIVHKLLQAYEYWRMKHLAVDLVILNERQSSYVQDLQIAIETLVRTTQSRSGSGSQTSGTIRVLRADLIPAETRALLLAVARVVLVAQRGSLSDQLQRVSDKAMSAQGKGTAPKTGIVPVQGVAPMAQGQDSSLPELEFFNGLGGFARDGKEYVTILKPGQTTPAPWINVIANSAFGFQVSAEGSAYTWSVSSRENQITPWMNDPVTDRTGEAFYIQDEESGAIWSPTAQPVRLPSATYIARHGHGYSQFEQESNGINVQMLQYVPVDGPVKISRLTLHNKSGTARRISVTAYVEWVLAASRSASLAFVTTEIDAETGAMFARNPWNNDFGGRVAFLDMQAAPSDWTADRREFMGRNGSLAKPAALQSAQAMSKTSGGGLDSCGVLRTRMTLAPGESKEIVVLLGQASTADRACSLILRYRAADLNIVLAEVCAFWDDILGHIAVKTPDRAMDIMLNGWLLYQTLACRVWARSAFYQASGAYGFRDQLQDGMALTSARPTLAREHLLRAAGRQFIEGDVQHWWLPHSGQGVRTRISDDRVWLGFTVAHYVSTTGDSAILDEVIPFLEGQKLASGEHDNFFLPSFSEAKGSLFEHCARALDASLAVGLHGLPLMGTGDWNDGMNRVGENGQGESVWLGWLLYATLLTFSDIAVHRQEEQRASQWRASAVKLQAALELEAWDGNWYRRAFFDDGTALGSAANDECRIDSIAQSWATLSGAAPRHRAVQAMAAVTDNLIREDQKLALLFAPPFDFTPLDPGYIKGYPAGIRENGGQYTHAATWSVMAYAELGNGDMAGKLFSLMNPINHARTADEVAVYKVEPYVIAADIYSVAPHIGRGGWAWYTGSAGWMQRAGVESLLGVRMLDGDLLLDPCIPKDWPEFEVKIRFLTATYVLHVENRDGSGRTVVAATLDGQDIADRPVRIKMVDDGLIHKIALRL